MRLLKQHIVILLAVLMTACGGSETDGGNGSQTLAEARTISSNIAHSDTVKEEYTLEFTAVDAAASPYFTLYLWEPVILSNQGTVTQAALEVHIYPDGGMGETCTPTWTGSNVATCQFSINNASQLNLDITNNSGGDVSYMYIFMPGNTPDDGSIPSPHRIPDSVIYDTYISETAGIVGNVIGDSAYYIVNSGSAGTAFDSEIFAVAGGNASNLAIELYDESTYTNSIYSCADLSSFSCDTIYNLTANTDYYLKVTNNGGTTDWIVYQLDLNPSNVVPFDYGLTVSLAIGATVANQPYSVYMFNSTGVAEAGLWSNNVMSAGGTLDATLKTLDVNGCVTATDASQIVSGTYTFVVSMMNVNIPVAPVLDKPSTCAGADGYISNGYEGGNLTIDMSFVDPSLGVNLGADTNGTSSLLINVDTGTAASQVICNAYISTYTGIDDKNRLATFSSALTAGAASFNTNSSHRLATGAYRLYCVADVDANGGESSGDKVFETILTMDTASVTQLSIDATNQASWIAVP